MSKLPYPRDPSPTVEGLTASVQDILRLVRAIAFPRSGSDIMQRLDAIEARLTAAEKKL